MSGITVGLMGRIRNAGIAANDTQEVRLNKSLMVFATGLVAVASMLWLPMYWQLDAERSMMLTLLFQFALTGNLAQYLRANNFHRFRLRQLALFLLFPFIAHWTLGNAFTGSGLLLWGLLGPVAALLCFGVAESLKWFIAYVLLIGLSAIIDATLIDAVELTRLKNLGQDGTLFFVVNLGVISSIVYLLLRYALKRKQTLEAMLQQTNQLLQIEQARSQRLLQNILPAPVAERLKNSDQPIADAFPDVSVMFADIVNFTPMAAAISPVDVFGLLNRVFTRFDELVERHGLEKIKTIGDAYMVAGGLNQHGGCGNDVASMAALALEMQDTLRAGFVVNGQRLKLRIGIATGPVVAGVLGRKKISYDLWGDTVNLASRLSTQARAGSILTDSTTHARLHHRFFFTDGGALALKGKGSVQAFELCQSHEGRHRARAMQTSVAPRAGSL